jgi:acyl-coenzyme A thioesterase PaaI-like protein
MTETDDEDRADGATDAVPGRPDAIFDPAAQGWEPYRDDDGFIGLVGPFWIRPDGDGFALGFLAEPRHRNRGGVVQGGMLMTLADRAIGLNARHVNGHQWSATVQFDSHFVDAARIGDFVEAQCRVVRRTKALIFMQATLLVGSRTVATVNGIWKVLARRP